jgi:hypothetical protein
MRLTGKTLCLLLALCVLSLSFGVSAASAAEAEPLDYSWMLSQCVAAKGEPVSQGDLTWQFLYGNLETEKELHIFPSLFGGDGGAGDGMSYPESADLNSGGTVFWRWQWRATNPNAAIIKLTADADMKLRVYETSDRSALWAFNSAFLFVTENTEGVRKTVKQINIAETITKETFETVVHLAKGEILYVAYQVMDGAASPATSQFVPQFAVDTTAYDAAQRPDYTDTAPPAPATAPPADPNAPAVTDPPVVGAPLPEELPAELDYPWMLTQVVAAQGGPVTVDVLTWQFLYGELDAGKELMVFPKFFGGDGGAGDGMAYPDVGDLNSGTNVLWRWQWRAQHPNATVLKVTAGADMKLRVYSSKDYPDGWATHAAWRFLTENTDGTRVLVKQININGVNTKENIEAEVHLAKGDIFYLSYQVMDGSNSSATSQLEPLFAVDTAGYDASARPDYASIAGLEALKDETAATLRAEYETLVGDGTVYSVGRAAEIEGFADDGINALADLTSAEEIQAVCDDALAKMRAVPTIAMEEAELKGFADEKKAELAAYAVETDYTKANWVIVQDHISQANEAVDSAKTAAAINTAVARAKANIDKVEKKTPGSGVSLPLILGIAAGAAVIAAVCVLILRKKRKK